VRLRRWRLKFGIVLSSELESPSAANTMIDSYLSIFRPFLPYPLIIYITRLLHPNLNPPDPATAEMADYEVPASGDPLWFRPGINAIVLASTFLVVELCIRHDGGIVMGLLIALIFCTPLLLIFGIVWNFSSHRFFQSRPFIWCDATGLSVSDMFTATWDNVRRIDLILSATKHGDVSVGLVIGLSKVVQLDKDHMDIQKINFRIYFDRTDWCATYALDELRQRALVRGSKLEPLYRRTSDYLRMREFREHYTK
jgi:hypothetical protein